MKPRDVIIVAAVVLIAGFAAADAIRGRGEHAVSPASTTPRQTTPTRLPGPRPQAEAPAGWPVGKLQGALIFTDARDCRVRVVGLADGVERPVARFAGSCQLWVPPVTQRFAYALGPSSADGFSPVRIADLEHPDRGLGGFRTLFGVVLWSHDGQRVAWCGRRRTGFDLEVDGAARRVADCPIAYTPADEIAYARGNRLLVGGKTVLRTNGGITFARYGVDGSLAVIIDGDRLERREGKLVTGTLKLGPGFQGYTPVFSPDNCAVAFSSSQTGATQVLDLGCFHGKARRTFFAHAATWSPDGRWLAVAERKAIAFHHMIGAEETIRWPASAVQLAWRAR